MFFDHFFIRKCLMMESSWFSNGDRDKNRREDRDRDTANWRRQQNYLRKTKHLFSVFLWVIFSGSFSETSQKMSESRTGQKTGWFVCEILGFLKKNCFVKGKKYL